MSTNIFEVDIKKDEISVQTTLADQSIPISMIPPRPARTSQHIIPLSWGCSMWKLEAAISKDGINKKKQINSSLHVNAAYVNASYVKNK